MSDLTRYQSASEVQIVSEAGYTADVTSDNELRVAATVSASPPTLVEQGKGFFTTTGPITLVSTGTEYNFFLLSNPSLSGKVIRILNIWQEFFPEAASKWAMSRYYRDPTITSNGTALTISKARKGQSQATVASAYKTPTISSRGTLITSRNLVDGTIPYQADGYLFVEQGETILLSIETSTGNRNHSISVGWSEE